MIFFSNLLFSFDLVIQEKLIKIHLDDSRVKLVVRKALQYPDINVDGSFHVTSTQFSDFMSQI